MSTLLIRGGLVWDDTTATWRDLDVSIRDERIVDLAPPAEGPAVERILHAEDCLVIPGLVNAHTHAHNNLLKGTGDRRWLESHINTMSTVAAWSPRQLYVSTMVGILEMLTTGTTTAYDMVRAPTDEHVAAVVQAYSDAGMRATIAPAVSDLAFIDTVPGLTDCLSTTLRAELEPGSAGAVSPRAKVDFAARAIRDWNGTAGGRVRIAVGPVTADSCSDELLRGLSRLATESGAPLHMHLLESKLQALNGLRRSGGRTWVEHLQAISAVPAHSTFAHAVWLTDDDVAVLADLGASIAHNPASNMKLGSGVAPVLSYSARGLNVAIATDGAASGDSLDMFAAMWLTALLNHARSPDPDEWLSARAVVEMATVGGAAALGLGEGLGTIRVGSLADVAVVSLQSPAMRPLNDPTIQLVYGGAGRCVRSVVVDGRVVVEDGEPTGVDRAALLAEAERTARALGTGLPLTGQAAELTAPLLELQKRLRDTAFAVDRYAAAAVTGPGHGGPG